MTAASAEASPSFAASAQASPAQRAEAEVARAAEQVDPDTLYVDRANLGSARRASEIWAADLKSSPPSFEGAWKLARVNYWLGGHAPEPERRAFLEQGIEAARKAIALQPDRAEGHFWLAANMGTMAESFGLRAGLKYRGPVKEELETVLKLDPSFMNGSADRVLGRWYLSRPAPLRRQRHESRAAPSPIVAIRREQHRLALLPRRAPHRPRAQRRSALGAPENHRRADQPRVGARRQGIQRQGAFTAREDQGLDPALPPACPTRSRTAHTGLRLATVKPERIPMTQHPASTVDTTPYWIESAPLPRFPKLERDEHVDVLIVGGGITGLTAAYLLAVAGKSVAASNAIDARRSTPDTPALI